VCGSTVTLDLFREGGIGFDIDLLLFDRTPAAFHKYVVVGSALALITDLDARSLQSLGKDMGGKLITLVAVKDLRLVDLQSRSQMRSKLLVNPNKIVLGSSITTIIRPRK
jgi:hypothetical protein